MKRVRIASAFALTMFLGTTLVAQQTAPKAESKNDQLVVPLSEPGKPFKLNVSLTNGGMTVVAYEGKDIIIDVVPDEKRKSRERERDKDREASGGMKRIQAGNGMDVSARENNNTVTVNTDSWRDNGMNLMIKVPNTQSTMKLHATNNGDIVVENVSGDFEVGNTNGAVTMTNISGSAVVNALNRNVKVSFKSIDAKAMAFSTLNGNIDVTFPAGLKANVKLKTDNGNMYTDFDMDADKTQAAPTKTSKDGVYRINVDNWVSGKIGGGGPELRMSNMNGNIYIRKAK